MLEATHVSEGERNCSTEKKVGASDFGKWCARDRLSLYKVIYIWCNTRVYMIYISTAREHANKFVCEHADVSKLLLNTSSSQQLTAAHSSSQQLTAAHSISQ